MCVKGARGGGGGVEIEAEREGAGGERVRPRPEMLCWLRDDEMSVQEMLQRVQCVIAHVGESPLRLSRVKCVRRAGGWERCLHQDQQDAAERRSSLTSEPDQNQSDNLLHVWAKCVFESAGVIVS